MTVGFANGCFDMLHMGHRHLLMNARWRCTKLIVGLNTDASVKALKGPGRPVQRYVVRHAALLASGWVDEIVPIESEVHLVATIRELSPDVLIKGDEYAMDQIKGSGYAGAVFRVPMLEGYSTTRQLQ